MGVSWAYHCTRQLPLCELAVDDFWVLMPFVGANPHLYLLAAQKEQCDEEYLSKRAQPSKNPTPDPRRVLALRGRRDPDLHVLHGQPLDLAH